MSFVTCSHCGASISEKAIRCPDCGEPQKKTKMKNCFSCGAEMEAKLKVCAKCGTNQDSNSNNKNTMAAKKNNAAQFILALILGVALGAGGMFAGKTDATVETKLGNEYATVMERWRNACIYWSKPN